MHPCPLRSTNVDQLSFFPVSGSTEVFLFLFFAIVINDLSYKLLRSKKSYENSDSAFLPGFYWKLITTCIIHHSSHEDKARSVLSIKRSLIPYFVPINREEKLRSCSKPPRKANCVSEKPGLAYQRSYWNPSRARNSE